MLSTRCGSEAYAAPELVTGGRGLYDARLTDAWACGVVLYALVNRRLVFGECGRADNGDGVGGAIGGERMDGGDVSERMGWLMKIAKGSWTWPSFSPSSEEGEELMGRTLVKSVGARRMCERLLVRDVRVRARIRELWSDEWMDVPFEGGGRLEEVDKGLVGREVV